MQNIDVADEKNLNKAHYTEAAGTGVLGSLIFMGLMFIFMFVISSFVK